MRPTWSRIQVEERMFINALVDREHQLEADLEREVVESHPKKPRTP